jgi:glycosyltransferase involved in cell wall biosynthesis
MICRDEEQLLLGSLASIKAVADEIVVGIDSRTTDQTGAIARAAGARVHHFDWCDDFSYARNIGLKKAKREWILVIDADERLTPFGAAMVEQVMRRARTDIFGYAFTIDQRDMSGKVIDTDPGITIRMFRNDGTICYVNRVHENLRKNGKTFNIGAFRQMPGLLHLGYDKQIYAEKAKHDRNLSLLLMEMADCPDNSWVMYNMSRQYHAVGETETAAKWARAALANPGDLPAPFIEICERLVRRAGVDGPAPIAHKLPRSTHEFSQFPPTAPAPRRLVGDRPLSH